MRDEHKIWNIQSFMLSYPNSLCKISLFMKYVSDIKKNCESLANNIPISQNPDF